MKALFVSAIVATLLLAGCASNPNDYANASSNNHYANAAYNNNDELVPAQHRGILGTLSPATSTALNGNEVNINSNNTNFNSTLPKSNNPPMHLVQNQSNYTKSVSTEVISGPGFRGTSQSVSASGFTTQVWKGTSRSTHVGAF